jgi:type II secretory pathway pseudopilin PulG
MVISHGQPEILAKNEMGRGEANAVQLSVVPAKAGIQTSRIYWVPAFAGTTHLKNFSPTEPHCSREAGFTFIGLMFAIAIAGIALAGTGVLWQMESRREKEKELLFVGEEYRKAISSYFGKSPGGDKQYPGKLEDLLQDKRFPNPVRHLRRLYPDPMTADGNWELILGEGRIIGVASRSRENPIKIAGFEKDQEGFGSAVSYAGWRFVSSGSGSVTVPGVAPTPGVAPVPSVKPGVIPGQRAN